jgi:hypothetical protein
MAGVSARLSAGLASPAGAVEAPPLIDSGQQLPAADKITTSHLLRLLPSPPSLVYWRPTPLKLGIHKLVVFCVRYYVRVQLISHPTYIGHLQLTSV